MEKENKTQESPKFVGIKDLVPGTTLPIIDPDHLVGHTCAIEHAASRWEVEVLIKNDDKFHMKYADGNEAHLTYEKIINLLGKETEDRYHLWFFTEILNHILVKWDGKNTI